MVVQYLFFKISFYFADPHPHQSDTKAPIQLYCMDVENDLDTAVETGLCSFIYNVLSGTRRHKLIAIPA